MKTNAIVTSICLGLFCIMPIQAKAGGLPTALQTSGKAVTYSAVAVSEGIATGGQVVLGVVAMPLLVSGAAGQVSTELGEEFWDAATQPIGTPLEISEETVTAGPPPDMMLQNQGAKREKI